MTPTVDINNHAGNMLPSLQRQSKWIAFAKGLVSYMQYLNLLFRYYMNGSIDTGYWSALVTYSEGDRVRSINGVYESLQDGNIGNAITDTTYWIKVLDYFTGVNTRVWYRANKLVFEYALNTYFNTTFRQPDDPVTPTPSDIYLTNDTISSTSMVIYPTPEDSSHIFPSYSTGYIYPSPVYGTSTTYTFTINIPLAVFNALGVNDAIRESIVRNFADKYAVTGTIYNVITY